MVITLSPSCSHKRPAFIQKDLIIVSPIKKAVTKTGEYVETTFNDGGTKMIRFTDAENHQFDLYIDHRIGEENEWGSLYLNGYPGTPASIHILDRDRFKEYFSNLHY